MKFFSKIIFISCIVSVFAAPYGSNSASRFSESCKIELNGIQHCISQKISKGNLNSVCEAAQSTQCQQFYSYPMSFVPSCQSVESLITASAEIFKNSVSIMCEKSETGEICPFTEYEITTGLTNIIYADKKESNIAEMKMDAAALTSIENTCKSPKCTEATKKYIKYLLDSNDSVTRAIAANFKFSALPTANKEVVEKLKSFLDILDGPNCVSSVQGVPSGQAVSSDNSMSSNNLISPDNSSTVSSTISSTIPSTSSSVDNVVSSNNNTNNINSNTTVETPQLLNNSNEENSFAITRYTVMSIILYMVLYCGFFKFVML